MNEKKLADWTLGEVQAYCAKRTGCSDCLLEARRSSGGCKLQDRAPEHWNIYEPALTDIPDTDVGKTEPDKPRICDLLTVDVGEEFEFATPYRVYDRVYIDEKGTMWAVTSTGYTHKAGGQSVCWIVNHPEAVNKLPPKPVLTEKEIAICKAVGARWVSRDTTNPDVCLWKHQPAIADQCGNVVWISEDDAIACIDRDLFLSVHPGDCLEVPV